MKPPLWGCILWVAFMAVGLALTVTCITACASAFRWRT